ncbi:helix-turn-helix domain-containing protein [Saccharothrix longispora]|uniref:winged helix-turn-helix transcriptional regulator n=1 Tax=Saccharothrix longispora TaxID=33920 RepID=UPI0028FD61C7|nr:helix-turn-helix domain-containing protein [Saccharothrix longispora]MBY8849329.1 helix-turn-helix transcriptional regulator [Saccharothrix sp. MB29]MDU0290388.1 helix-turn-helix domain-containing protein [Saccharothrix longispora]
MQPIESPDRGVTTPPGAPERPTTTPAGGWSDPPCPVARAVDLIGDKWSLLILRDALDGARSFTAFQRSLGVAKNILADRLRRLVDHGVLIRRTAPSGKRQEYVLADSGEQMFTVIVALRQWGEAHTFDSGEPHSVLVDDETGARVPPLRVERSDGAPLNARNTHVERLA